MMRSKTDFMRWYAMVVSSLLRNERECSLSELLILLEIDEAGELSTLALERRLHAHGVKNARMVLTRAEQLRFVVQADRREDGRWWRLTEKGEGVLRRAIERIMPRKA